MGRRGERRLNKLYDLTERLAGPEITPVLEGNCRIQGPVDESDRDRRRSYSDLFPAEKGFKFVTKSLHTRAESGTCNVCSSPCSSCLNFNRTLSIMESNIECGFSSNVLRRKGTGNCFPISVDKLPNLKSRACGNQPGTSEMSNQSSASSSHDSYSENADSTATLRASAAYDTSEDVVLPPKVPSGDEIGDDINEKTVTSHGLLSSRSFPTSGSHQKQLGDPVPEKDKLECNVDNVSCITAARDVRCTVRDRNMDFNKKEEVSSVSTKSVLDKGAKELVEVVARGFCDNEIEKSKAKSPSSSPCSKESLKENNSGNNGLEGDSSSPHLVESVECSKKIVEASFGGLLAADSVDEKKSTIDREDDQTGHARSSLGISKNVNSCLETENGADIGTLCDEALKCSATNEPPEKTGSLLDASSIKGPEAQSQLTPEGGSSESAFEDDVKVCDICGDAGREEFLAICSKCSDGAEHTYCMRIMLDKVPEGDWLCEECKLKDDKSESVNESSNKRSLKEKSQNVGSILNPKLLPKLDTKTIVPEERRLNKGPQTPQTSSSKKLSDNLEFTSVSRKRVNESIGGSETGSPKKKSVLSSSFNNLDVGKGKPASISQSFGHKTANTSQVFVRSPTLSVPDAIKNQLQLETSRGQLSKSTSFNSSHVKGKVIQLIGSVSHKQRISKESASVDRRKDGLMRTVSKSTSFKGLSPGRSRAESVTKFSSLISPRAEDPKGTKYIKERSAIERKSSFMADSSIISPSPIADTNFPPLKLDQKAGRYERKLNNLSEPAILGINRGLENASDLGRNEVNKQSLTLSKGVDGPYSNGMCNSEGQKQSVLAQQGRPEAAEPAHHGIKAKDPSFSSSLRQAVPTGSRVLRCQKCNETGHATRLCSIDKLCASALKFSAQQTPPLGSVKGSRWRDAAESAILKSRMQKCDKDEVADSCSDVPSTDTPSSSYRSLENFPIPMERTDVQGILKHAVADQSRTVPATGFKQKDREEGGAILASANELNVKPSTEMLPAQNSVLGYSLRASAFPELDFIWQGAFDVIRTGSVRELFDGVQAHLSSCASRKVHDVATSFPCNIKLEEMPRQSVWPTQFEISGPKEDNIALFFFAKDNESFAKNYRKLLDHMLKNDFALKGSVDGVELLIFPSTTLPANSQCWNTLFFFWGLFRDRRIDCVQGLPGFQERPCSSSLDMEPIIQHVSASVVAEVSQKKDLCDNHNKKLSMSDISLKAKTHQCSIDADLEPVSSFKRQKICKAQEYPLGQTSLIQAAAADKLPPGAPSCSYPVRYSWESIGQPDPMQLGAELKSAIHLRNMDSDPSEGKDLDSQAHVHPNDLQISSCKSNGLPIHAVAFRGQGIGAESTNDMRTREEEVHVKSESAVDGDCIELDHASWESRPNRKHSRCSIDTVSHAPGETSKITGEVMPWRDINCVYTEDVKDHKKMKRNSVENAGSSSYREEMRDPLLCGFLNTNPHRDYGGNLMPGTSSSERYFFPVDRGSDLVMDTRTEKVIHVLSSDDEDFMDSDAPNLELALGAMKKPSKKESSSLFFSLVGRNNKQDKILADDGDDVPASLSLSLAVPDLNKEVKSKPIPKAEPLLPERLSVNTTLLLFRGFPDT